MSRPSAFVEPRRHTVRLLLATALAVAVTSSAFAQDRLVFPGATWEVHEAPSELGWDPAALASLEGIAVDINAAAVMVVDRGHLVFEWGRTEHRFNSHSVRKSLLSALFGIYVEEGAIDLDATMEELGIDDHDPLTDVERRATVLDLLRARSGVYHPAAYETASMTASKPPRGSHEPGTFWHYNNWDFNASGTIFEQETGIGIGEAFGERIAQPLQMQDFRPEDVHYVLEEQSVHRAYPFRITGRDLARFGLLYLAEGVWRGERIVPRTWVQLSRTPQERLGSPEDPFDHELFWWIRQTPSGVDMYYAAGVGGQHVFVLPDEGLVVVTRADTDAECPGGCDLVSRGEATRLIETVLDAR